MDWKLMASTFAAIFVAELGDKTQLAAFALSAGSKNRLAVFLATAGALTVAAALAVLAGGAIGRFVSPKTLTRAGGVLMVVLGAWMLAKPGE